MISVANISIRYSVLVNMITIAILLMGLISMISLPREEYPAVDFGSVFVIVVYPGVSPAEIEQLIVSKIETVLSGIEGLDYIDSTAEEGRASIRVVFEASKDPEKAFDEVSREMNKVNDLPKDAFDPVIIRLNMREVNPIAQVVLGGDFSASILKDIADKVEDGLLNIDNISKVDVVGVRERQIWVDADQNKLDAYGITLSELSSLLQGRNLNIPAGTTRFGKIEFLVRTLGEFNSVDEVASMIVQSDASGRAIRVGEIATVRDTLAKPQTVSKLQGERSASIFLYKRGEGNIIKVMQDVRAYVEETRQSIPGLKIDIRNDGSMDVKNGINALGSSAFQGIFLVFITLLVFLGWKNALFASFGIPLSLFIAFIVIPLFDVTLNNLTIFAMIVVVGMVVDNAIVVLENVHRLREEGYCTKDSIIMGVDQVIMPIFSSTLTTVAAFMPMLIMTGMMGKFLSVFPVVVSIALLGSWFQSMVVLPNNIYQFGQSAHGNNDRTSKIIKPIVEWYKRALTRALKNRALTLWSVIIMLIASFGIMGSGLIKFEFFPSPLAQTIVLQLQTPIGTSLDETEAVVNRVEDFILNMEEKQDIQFVVTNVGAIGSEGRRDIKTSNAQINIDLVDLKDMKYDHDRIKNSIRKYLESLPGLYSFRFSQPRSGPPVGNDIDLRIKGDDLERLAFIGEVVKTNLRKIEGVSDIDDSFEKGKKEVRILPHHEKLSMYNLTVAQIASTIRTASAGTEVTKYRGSGIEEYPLIVKLHDSYTQDLEILKNLKIRTRTGELIAIRDLADFEISASLSRINHRDKKRLINITGSVTTYQDGGKTRKRTPQEVVDILIGNNLKGKTGLIPNFEQRFPGYTIEFGGVQEEQRKSYASLGKAFILALLVIFTILASQFRSYVQPLIVMLTIPFAFIGVILGLLVTGLPFSLNTLISVVALAGVVVNNAIILIDFINSEREKGIDRWHAIINSGAVRLRPILLTTTTTVAGMLPLVFSTDPSSQAWRPLAVSFTFGLLFATVLTLFIIPIIYSMVDSFFGRFKLTRFSEHTKFADAIDCKKV